MTNPVFPLIIPEFNGLPIVPENYIEHLIQNGVNRFMSTEGTSTFWKFSQEELFVFHSDLVSFLLNRFHRNEKKDFELTIGLKEDTQKNIIKTLENYSSRFPGMNNIKFLLLFPDRFYENRNVVRYFEPILEKFDNIWIHLKPMRSGYGLKWVDWDSNLVSDLELLGLKGFKEESQSFENTKQIIRMSHFSRIKAKDRVVAGGDIKKFFNLHIEKLKCSFLSGLGSIIPKFDLSFDPKNPFEHFDRWNKMQNIVQQIGWHRFLFTSLVVSGKLLKEIDRFGNVDNRFLPTWEIYLKDWLEKFDEEK